MRAAELVPMELAERRVLVLSDPGRGANAMQATGLVYAGIQVLLPGESAPVHRHSPSAARIVIEGAGGYTVVNGTRYAMRHGDVILTPSAQWHGHGHDGTGPVLWLDVLDLPTLTAAEAAYSERDLSGQSEPDRLSQLGTELRGKGFKISEQLTQPQNYPQVNYSWEEARLSLTRLADLMPPDQLPQLGYVNPETGQSCLPTLGFTAFMLRARRRYVLKRRSSGAVFHCIEGIGAARAGQTSFEWGRGDTFSAPPFEVIELDNSDSATPAFVLRVDDEPVQRRLGFFVER
jgi:gentisate 1,2-dioxygenase